MKREPDINNLLKVLRREKPDRPTIFELFLNAPLYEKLAGKPFPTSGNAVDNQNFLIKAFINGGYDYASTHASAYRLPSAGKESKLSHSLNDGIFITDRESFNGYALGTGNSVPAYIPDDHYFAMTKAALE